MRIYISFLDVSPLREGHALVVPKLEVDHLFDWEGAELTGILPFAKQVRSPQDQSRGAVYPDWISVVGLEVPHAHIHLIPIDRMSDMDFTRTRATFTPSEFEALAERIRQARTN